MTAKDSSKSEVKVYWVRDSGAELHRSCFSRRENVNSEQGGVLEVENGTRNFANLDGLANDLASCGNASVTEKDFKSCGMRILMRDENSFDAR